VLKEVGIRKELSWKRGVIDWLKLNFLNINLNGGAKWKN